MREVLIVFIILLVLILVISTLGGSLKEVPTSNASAWDYIDMKKERFQNNFVLPEAPSFVMPEFPPLPEVKLDTMPTVPINAVEEEQKIDLGIFIEPFEDVQIYSAV